MFALGHLGIGKKLAARPFRELLPGRQARLLRGGAAPRSDRQAALLHPGLGDREARAAAGILSGTHLFAHTALFLLVLAVAALVTRSGPLRALAIGVATHFVLDFVGLSMKWGTLLWPLLGWQLPDLPVPEPRPASEDDLQPHHLHR